MKSTSRTLLALWLCTLLAGPAVPARAQPAVDDFAAVDSYVADILQRFPIPGLSVAIVEGDRVLYLKGYGQANMDGDRVTPQTPFVIGSITKTFTALAVRQLQRDRRLDLDAPVQDYIPEFQLADEQAAARLTIRQLLDHTSGLSTMVGNDPYLSAPEATMPGMLALLARYRPQHQPGQHYEYSNINYGLLQEIIVRVTGAPYVDYVQHHILDPLEMTRSTFADYKTIPDGASYRLFAYGFSFPYDERPVPIMLGVGRLSSSAEDMSHYMTAFFTRGQYQGRDLLPAEGPGWYDSIWEWHSETASEDSYAAFSGAFNSTNAHMQLWFRRQLGVAVLMNTRLEQPIPGPTAYVVASDIARIVMGRRYMAPSSTGFYAAWALADTFVVCALASVGWQAAHLKGWRKQYLLAKRGKRSALQLGMGVDIVVGILTLLIPYVFESNWPVTLRQRPDLAIPLLVIGLGLCALGLVHAALSIASRERSVTGSP